MFLAYLDGIITEPSSSTTGGNYKVGLNWDLMIKNSVLSQFNLNLQERNSKGAVNTKIHDENFHKWLL